MEEKNINKNSEEIISETNKEVDEVSTTNIEEKENNISRMVYGMTTHHKCMQRVNW